VRLPSIKKFPDPICEPHESSNTAAASPSVNLLSGDLSCFIETSLTIQF
jgi:hypothetical protein